MYRWQKKHRQKVWRTTISTAATRPLQKKTTWARLPRLWILAKYKAKTQQNDRFNKKVGKCRLHLILTKRHQATGQLHRKIFTISDSLVRGSKILRCSRRRFTIWPQELKRPHELSHYPLLFYHRKAPSTRFQRKTMVICQLHRRHVVRLCGLTLSWRSPQAISLQIVTQSPA